MYYDTVGRRGGLRENCGQSTLSMGERDCQVRNRGTGHRRVGPMRSFSAKDTGISIVLPVLFSWEGSYGESIYGKDTRHHWAGDKVKGERGNGAMSRAIKYRSS